MSSGGAIIDALDKLKADNLSPDEALCVIDRETGGKEALAAAGLHSERYSRCRRWMVPNNAFERSVRRRGPRLAAARSSWPAAQLGRRATST